MDSARSRGVGVRRAFRDPAHYRGKISGSILTALSALMVALFLVFVTYFAKRIPSADTALGVGAIMAASSSTAQASDLTSSGTSSSQTLAVAPGNANNSQTFAAGPGAQGNCEAVTVTSVNGNTIVAKTASGSSVTIHTTASTRYTQAGNTVAASAIKVGTRIHIMGTHNSDGSITATSIDVG